ncbi:hypothetical protein ACFXO9_26915 [Nocardia tengchongensis]
MSGVDDYDNAMIESFWSRPQVELLGSRRWSTRVELAFLEIFYPR